MDCLHKFTITINGKENRFFCKDIVSFLSTIDAQYGKLADSGMEHLIKDKIEIEEEDNGECWWSPNDSETVYGVMNYFRKNRK